MTFTRRTTLPAAALLLGGALLSVAPASAQDPVMCRGEVATIVATDAKAPVTGTDGRDVIVAIGNVAALGGDDVICAVGYDYFPVDSPHIDAGPGNDVVQLSSTTASAITVALGQGQDEFHGGDEADNVYAGTVEGQDVEKDVINTGGPPAGASVDSDGFSIYVGNVWSGQPGVPNADVITMASGQLTWAGIPADGAAADGGGRGTATFERSSRDAIVLDSRAGTLSVNGQRPMEFVGFTRFEFGLERPFDLGSLEFHGSDAAETLLIGTVATSRHLVSMGGGNDVVRVGSDSAAGVDPRASYDGGAGRDTFNADLDRTRHVELHLSRGRLRAGRGETAATVPARRFEDARLQGRHAELVGTAGANDLDVFACRSRVRGLAGRDRITGEIAFDTSACSSSRGNWDGGRGADELIGKFVDSVRLAGGRGADMLVGSHQSDRLLGGRGADKMVGEPGRDHLIGGKGRDRAKGSAGRDVCQAERVWSCEIRARR